MTRASAGHLHRQLVSVTLAIVALTVLTHGWHIPVQAGAEAPDWEPTPLTEDVLRIFVQDDGVLFAHLLKRSEDGIELLRSQDGGTTWHDIALPPNVTRITGGRPRQVAVSAVLAGQMFVDGQHGLYRSSDAGTTWTLLQLAAGHGSWVESLAISTADPSLIYAWVTSRERSSEGLTLLRSHDQGATWAVVRHESRQMGCTYGVPFFWLHPTDIHRAYAQFGCYGISSKIGSLLHSTDGGVTWTQVTPTTAPVMGGPRRLIGGQGVHPERFYLATETSTGPSGQYVFRSDTGVGDWSPIFHLPGVSPSALAYDPQNPNHVYLGVSTHQELAAPSAVWESTDGGASWVPFGRQDIGSVHDLSFSSDGGLLYAATNLGVFRMRLTR